MLDLSNLQFGNLPIRELAMLLMYLVTGLYAVYSAVFYYHWKTYGTDPKISGLTLILYFATTMPLLLFIIAAAFII